MGEEAVGRRGVVDGDGVEADAEDEVVVVDDC